MVNAVIYETETGIVRRSLSSNMNPDEIESREVLDTDESFVIVPRSLSLDTERIDPDSGNIVPWDNPDYVTHQPGYVTPSLKGTTEGMGDGSAIVDEDGATSATVPAGEGVTLGAFSDSDGIAVEVSGATTLTVTESETGTSFDLSLAGGYEELIFPSEIEADAEVVNSGSSDVDVTSVELHQTG